jgi:transcription antitermination factor NusG
MSPSFVPNMRVEVIGGTFVGFSGVILSAAQANSLDESSNEYTVGRRRDLPGQAFVAVTVFGRSTPVQVEEQFLRPIE